MTFESRAGIQTCAECASPMTLGGTMATMVGYLSPQGHNHDDNCLTASYRCPNGHLARVTHRRKCPADGCNWIGKLECFCHKGEKVGVWINEVRSRE